MTIVPFAAAHADGFRSLVVETLREFDFEADPELDTDLVDPGAAYSALWVAVEGDEVVGSVALREVDPEHFARGVKASGERGLDFPW